MPGKVGVKIKAGRNLPVMDRSSDTTDAFVEIKLGKWTHKTDVCRKSLNPQWNTDWFRFEVDDAELQDEPLQIRLMDYDTYSANDAIGKVNISLNPLCLETASGHGKGTVLSGWIPVFDTMHGIRGEVNVIVKVDLFSDANKFRQSSCGIPFYHSPCIPFGYRAQVIHGFVEELVVNDDPEYQWIDKIRTPRASNEARQVVFLKLSGQVQRKMGLKAINMGANAVIGYRQCFDLEGDVGVVARGIGTAVTLLKDVTTQPPVADNALIEESTTKYLEFLWGVGGTHKAQGKQSKQMHGHVSKLMQPKFEIQRSHSSTLFELKHAEEVLYSDETDVMQALMRQEEERGEICKPSTSKLLKQQMRRFTSSSRNLFNLLNRSEDSNNSSKFLDDYQTSQNNSGFLLQPTVSELPKAIMTDLVVRKTHKTKTKPMPKPVLQRAQAIGSLGEKTPQIVRSISDDLAMAAHKNNKNLLVTSHLAGVTEYQDNARSTPNIDNEVLCITEKNGAPYMAGSAWYSLDGADETSSSTTEEDDFDRKEIDEEEHAKILELLQCGSTDELSTVDDFIEEDGDDEDALNKNEQLANDENAWIQPGANDDGDEGINTLPRHTVMDELKSFSHHFQNLIHAPRDKKLLDNSQNKNVKETSTNEQQLQQQKPSKDLTKWSKSNGHMRQFLYASPAELTDACNIANAVAQTIDFACYASSLDLKHLHHDQPTHQEVDIKPASRMIQSYSLMNLSELSLENPICTKLPSSADLALPITNNLSKQEIKTSETISVCAPNNSTTLVQPKESIPLFCKGSSTSIPSAPSTPPHLEKQAYKNGECVIKFVIEDYCVPTTVTELEENILLCAPCVATPPVNVNDKSNVKLNNSNNLNKTNNDVRFIKNTNHLNPSSFMLSPYIATTCTSTKPIATTMLPATVPHQLHVKPRHLQNRSQNEGGVTTAASVASAGVTTASTDSPSMKRFASPASAAVAASAATGTNNNHNNYITTLQSSGSKLTTSPSKLLHNQQIVADNASTTTTNSTATNSGSTGITVLSKENKMNEMCRRSSDSDLSITPKGNLICVASDRLVAATAMMRLSQPTVNTKCSTNDGMEMLEYPFLTMTKYPSSFVLQLGATVAARSVKLLERVPNPDEPEVRDSWWTELRMEIRSHARALGCNVVLGYSESTTISDDVCVLSATGTAAVINMAYNRSVSQNEIFNTSKNSGGAAAMSASLEEREIVSKEGRSNLQATEINALSKENMSSSLGTSSNSTNAGKKQYFPTLLMAKTNACNICHVPYSLNSVPFNVKMQKCAICRKGCVPDVLLATLEVPECLQLTGRGCFMQAEVVRAKKDLRSELNAKEISDALPFLEYELHRVLINKLKAKGMNAVFALKTQVAIGERMIALIATGTAVFITALPVPQVPKIVAGNSWTDKQKLNELQKKLQETFERNQEIYQLKCIGQNNCGLEKLEKQQSDTDESDDEVVEVDLNFGNKDTCVLEVDDIEDLEIISLLMEPYPPEGFHVVSTQSVPGLVDIEAVKNLQMFTQIWRAKLELVGQNVNGFPKHFQRLLQTIYFKLRTMIPCAICDLRFRLDLPESDQIQLLVTGMALGLSETNKFKYRRKTYNGCGDAVVDGNSGTGGFKRSTHEEDYIFPLDEDQMVETPTPTSNLPPYGAHSLKLRKPSPSRNLSNATMTGPTSNGTQVQVSTRHKNYPLRDHYGVDITPLCFIPGSRIDKYLGNLNFFFIRECTSIRENGGISGFVHSFITEVLAVVRAHVVSLGGNAMVSFYMTELILVDNQHKNQGQCLISIGGDAVSVSYFADE